MTWAICFNVHSPHLDSTAHGFKETADLQNICDLQQEKCLQELQGRGCIPHSCKLNKSREVTSVREYELQPLLHIQTGEF